MVSRMDDYISRQTAMDCLTGIFEDPVSLHEYIATTLKKLRNAPSADVQPVVRCKDCKYFDSGTDEDGKPFFKCLGWVYGGTSEDDFCSHGERKDG